MRFNDNLLLQKQQQGEIERQKQAQAILEEAALKVDQIYAARCQFRDPLAESQARIRALQRRATATPGPNQAASEPASMKTSVTASGQPNLIDPDFVTKEVTVRHLNDSTRVNPQAFKLYRKLRFGTK